MANWYPYCVDGVERSNTEVSDILNPDEYQDVINETGGNIIDSVLGQEFSSYPYGPEETKMYCAPPLPSADSTFIGNSNMISTGPLPAREDYPGPFAFSVLLDGVESTKNKWTYSTMLNKLYIVWDKIIPIQFKWIPTEPNFVVRALPVYTDAQDMKTPVERCFIHSNGTDPSNEGFDYVNHVIRSDNPGAFYEENSESKRCSVVVPLGELQPGTGTVTVTYKFMCKTTCTTGMMRRPITVLFTLERANGEVVGRQKLNVKICSCPKRDMQKDESSANDKQESGSRKRPLSAGKNLKTEDEQDYYSFEVHVENRHIYKSLLESGLGTILRLMKYSMKNHPSHAELAKLLKDFEGKLKNLDF